jgi:hypothetical protein
MEAATAAGTQDLTHFLKSLGEAVDVLHMVAHTTDVVGCQRRALGARAVLEWRRSAGTTLLTWRDRDNQLRVHIPQSRRCSCCTRRLRAAVSGGS